ncbi:nucleotidyltransferase domain-containing protein [Myroides sp. NP-2]|uniref:nucleotidyltransferase domain-containing protein n=1 Tax=Myroides sp. NP-2 TaxID=2759945 RepID=UPI0015F820C1|nr:nucleotidyltransferase domain-containing protein [Myroides sp. NP-2]MBB1148876.1 nucleotidyltransferase domain-containing protein [Myroides sp. NP-2]
MKNIIQQKIKEIESSHGIEVLYACESGSRAWGFASVDSDYDVRLIYKRKQADYVSVLEPSDFLQLPMDGLWDFNAWDLKKVLGLLIRSNTTVFEWIQSPIVYRETSLFKEELWQLCQNYYCQQTHTYHYLGLAKKKILENQEEQIKYKSLFYILRALLSAQWNVQFNCIAPMEFAPLLVLVQDEALKEDILQLMKEKESLTEKEMYFWSANLKAYIMALYDSLSKATVHKSKNDFDQEQINFFFRKEVMK